MGVEITAVFDDKEVDEFLQGMSSRLKDVKDGEKKYIGLLSSIVFQDVMSHFKDELGSGGPWQKWSKSYTKHMEKIGRASNQKLQFNGTLRNNFKPTNVKSSSAGPIWFNDMKTKKGFPYAYAHNEGGPKLPKRDFMWLSDEATEKIGDQTLAFMLDEGI